MVVASGEPDEVIVRHTLGEVVFSGGSDADALRAIAAGDRRAFETLYARHRQPLWSFIRQFVADAQLAEEVLQDTLVALWHSAGSFRGEAQVSTWLFAIARRQAYTHLRRRRPVPVDATDGDPVMDPEPPPDRVVAARDELQRVSGWLDELSTELRETLLLALAGDLSYPEIAEVLGVPLGTVKSRVANARRQLAAKVAGEEVTP
jgi:RNA polymerase sigma-70 factor, ECF subfamily